MKLISNHPLARGGEDEFYDAQAYQARYAAKRQRLKNLLGDQFDAHYQEARDSHNKRARINLDNSEGHFYCYVLPEFHDDGSFEPWGDRDVPWSAPA